jgi:hypothetical protein
MDKRLTRALINNHVVVITGPKASGKTHSVLEAVESLNLTTQNLKYTLHEVHDDVVSCNLPELLITPTLGIQSVYLIDNIDKSILRKLSVVLKWLNNTKLRPKHLAHAIVFILDDNVWSPQTRNIPHCKKFKFGLPDYKLKEYIVDKHLVERNIAMSRVAKQQILGNAGYDLHTLIRRLRSIQEDCEVVSSSTDAVVLNALTGERLVDVNIDEEEAIFKVISNSMAGEMTNHKKKQLQKNYVSMAISRFGQSSVFDNVSNSIDNNISSMAECVEMHDLMCDIDLMSYAGGAHVNQLVDNDTNCVGGNFVAVLLRLGLDTMTTMSTRPYIGRLPRAVGQTLEYRITRHVIMYREHVDQIHQTINEHIETLVRRRRIQKGLFAPYSDAPINIQRRFFSGAKAVQEGDGLARRNVLKFKLKQNKDNAMNYPHLENVKRRKCNKKNKKTINSKKRKMIQNPKGAKKLKKRETKQMSKSKQTVLRFRNGILWYP